MSITEALSRQREVLDQESAFRGEELVRRVHTILQRGMSREKVLRPWAKERV